MDGEILPWSVPTTTTFLIVCKQFFLFCYLYTQGHQNQEEVEVWVEMCSVDTEQGQ